MKRAFLLAVAVFGFAWVGGAGSALDDDFLMLNVLPYSPGREPSLEAAFENPPQEAGAVAWWHWCDGNVTEKGITRDFEAMAAAGLAGATVFHGGFGFPQENTLDPELTYRSPKWWRAMRHAADEAKRLGLDFGFHNCPGYSTSGGTWITPELAMKKLVATTDGTQPKADPRFYRDISSVTVTNLDGTVATYRLGYTLTGKCTHPTPREICGKTLEADKLSAKAMHVHWANVFGETAKHIPSGRPGLGHVLMDSYEAGDCNWSETFRADFFRLRGYDPVPLLPILFGAKVVSEEHCERFREDMKLTVQELYNECHYATYAAEAHRYGLYTQLEPYSGPFDPYEAAGYADEPMTEFWAFPCFWEKTWSPVKRGGAYHAGAIGRALGREICGAESFTAMPFDDPWRIAPRHLKRSLDGTFAGGVNRIHLHHWTHQPFDPTVKPGFSMGFWGTHFGECQTWFESGKAFYRYIQRCQALLQRGRLVVDAIGLNWDYGRWDAVSRSRFLADLSVAEDGRVAMPCGRTYALFMLPKGWKPTLPELEKLERLVAGGAAVWGKRPERLLGLAGGAAADRRFKELVARIWNGANPRLFEGCTEDEALAKLGVKPAFEVVSRLEKGSVLASPREENGRAFFFVSNQTTNYLAFTAAFRTRDRFAEVWHPETCRRFPVPVRAADDGRALVDLKLRGEGAVFVVFRKDRSPLAPEPVRGAAARTLDGVWTLEIAGKRLEGIRLPHDWSKAEDPEVAAFSGTAVYRTRFKLDAAGGESELRLGAVREIARVRLNGRDLGVAWYGDFGVRVPAGVLRTGENDLEVEVTNTWMNRLIADEKLPDDCEWIVDTVGGNLKDFYQRPRRFGSGIKRLPEWLVKGGKRPSGRQSFCTWNYFLGGDFAAPCSGLSGPVVLAPR